jgi:serine/threonine protein phosphatase PrpC
MSAETGAATPAYLAGGLSEKGRRDSNEDAAILAVSPPASSVRAFAVLCDGMGGHNAGEVASRLAVEILRDRIQSFADRPRGETPIAAASIEAEIHEWVAEVNREIFQRGKSSAEQRGMGTTVALAMVLPDDRLVVANVGDSKIFLVSGLAVRQLSVDHTALAEQRRALGSDSVAPEDDERNPFAHALTRSLGQEKKVVADVRSDVTLGLGDVVILTTDGVTDVLETERFLTALEATKSLQATAEEIYRLALEAGSKDNISVALISHGTPSHLGITSPHQTASPPPPARIGDGILVAGAASAPEARPGSRPDARRFLLLGVAAVALLALGLAGGFLLRSTSLRTGPEANVQPAPVPPSPAPPAPAAALPTATPIPVVPSTPPPVPAEAAPIPQAPPVPRPSPRPAPPVSHEPAFRTPAALGDLKPLEYPPTPTDTPTPTATSTATPTLPPTAVPSPLPSGAAPPRAPTPRVSG